MKKLFLVDGSNLLFQMFYGMPARITAPDGHPVQGTVGFVGALLKMLRAVQPTHAAVFFDGERTWQRKEQLAEYKANRPDYSGVPFWQTPFSQLADIRAALDKLGIAHAETTCCEADDWFAAYARSMGEDTQLVISSWDSDLFQLVSERVSLLRYRGKATQLYKAEDVLQRFGVQPSQFAAYKALVGDSADNIRGVRGIGPKTAARLLAQHGDLAALLHAAARAEVAPPRLAESILQSKQQLLAAYGAIALAGDVPLPFSLQQMQYAESGCTASGLLREMGLLEQKEKTAPCDAL